MPPSVSIGRRTTGASFALAIAALLAWDLSAERFLGDEQLVRGQRLARVGETGCEFSLGTGEGSGWFVPSALRALPAGTGRCLEIAASGELDAEFQVFLDLGRGYGSRDMVRLAAEPVEAPR